MNRFLTALGLMVCAAGVSGAEEPGTPPPAVAPRAQEPTVLASVERVRELCLSLRPTERLFFPGDEAARKAAAEGHAGAREAALGRRYRLRIPAGGFRFVEYREDPGAFVADLSRPLRALRGAVLVSASKSEAPFPMTAEAAGAVPASAALELTFSLDRTGATPCTGNAGVDLYTVRAVPLTVELVDKAGSLLARFDFPPAQPEPEPVTSPAVARP